MLTNQQNNKSKSIGSARVNPNLTTFESEFLAKMLKFSVSPPKL